MQLALAGKALLFEAESQQQHGLWRKTNLINKYMNIKVNKVNKTYILVKKEYVKLEEAAVAEESAGLSVSVMVRSFSFQLLHWTLDDWTLVAVNESAIVDHL